MTMSAEPQRATAVVIGPLPPPRHGQAVSNSAAISALEAAGWLVHSIDTSPGLLDRGMVYYIRRLQRLAAGALAAVRLRRLRPALVYCGLSGGPGLVADALLLRLIAGKRRTRVVLHHHNFTYVDADSRWMRFVLRFGPGDAKHLLLCECMRTRFCERYAMTESATMVVDNLALRSAAGELQHAEERSHPRDQFRVGYLGAISEDKGFDLFAAVQREVVAAGLENRVTFECAGMVSGNSCAELLRRQPALNHIGVLDADGVTEFLGRQSLLLFPSRFEAQPNVIIEALSSAVPVLATPRGCIGELLEPHLGALLVDEKEYVNRAMELIGRAVRDRSVEHSLHRDAVQQFDHVLLRSVAQQALWDATVEVLSRSRP